MRIIIIGSGKAVYFLARQFIRRHHHVTVVNRNEPDSIKLARQTNATVVLGDGTDLDVLEEAGVRRADMVLALTPHDEDNLIACQIVQRLYGVQRVLALVNDPDNEPIFRELGVPVTFSATQFIASTIEHQTDRSAVSYCPLPIADGRVNISDVRVPKGAPAVGKTLGELMLPDGVLVACVIRGDEVTVPGGATRLQAEDHLLLIVEPRLNGEVLQRLVGDHG